MTVPGHVPAPPPPAGQGWTAFSLPGTESGFTSRAWYKQVDAADAPRTDYTFTFESINNSAILYIAAFFEDSGTGNWTLEDGTGWAFAATANSLSNGGVTAVDNSLFVVAYGNDDNEVVTSNPIGPTKIDEDMAVGDALAAYYEMVDAIDGSVSYPITWGGLAEELSAMAGIFSWTVTPTPAVTSAVAEISPNDVTTSSTANAFSYDIQATIGGGDTGVNRVAITVPGSFGVPTITGVQVDGVGVAYTNNTVGNAISVDLTTKVTVSSKITVLFTANAPTIQDLTGVAFLSTVDDSGTADVPQATTEGNGDGDAVDANSWTAPRAPLTAASTITKRRQANVNDAAE